MAKRKKSQVVTDAKKFYRLLLYSASSGNLGTKPEVDARSEGMTFSEKRGLLDSIIKIAQLEAKTGDEEDESGFEKIRKSLNDSGASGSSGDSWGAKGGSDEPDGTDAENSSDHGS